MSSLRRYAGIIDREYHHAQSIRRQAENYKRFAPKVGEGVNGHGKQTHDFKKHIHIDQG